jgi:hypothetical protein
MSCTVRYEEKGVIVRRAARFVNIDRSPAKVNPKAGSARESLIHIPYITKEGNPSLVRTKRGCL